LKDNRFRLRARISSENMGAIKPVLEKLIGKGMIREEGGEFIVEAEFVGDDVKELNRSLLSRLRGSVKKTRLRAEWTSGDDTVYRFFDYVLKKTFKAGKS
jgi:hypothetical protein